MKIAGHKKQVTLFLTAVLLPVVVLVALTMRMVRQERELTQKRISDEHRSRVREIGQELALRLETLVGQEAAAIAAEPEKIGLRQYVNPEVVLLARVHDTRLVLPWEIHPDGSESVTHGNDSGFGRILRQAEIAEFSGKNYTLAAERYGRAASTADSSAQAGYARLQRARSLLKMKKERESLLEYEDVLSLAPGVIDEYGIPVSLYAADQLLQSGSHHELVVERIGAQLESGVWLSPAGVYLMKDILEKAFGDAPETAGASLRAVTEDCLRRVLGLILTTEQGLSLKDDYPHLGLEPFAGTKLNGDKALWVSYGQTPWLVGLSAPLPDRAVLLAAVDFQAFSSSYLSNARGLSSPARDFDLVTGFPADGTALGSAFPGLSIVFGTGAEEAYSKQWSLQRLFYFIALVVVLSVTLFGAYLLWRDVRREVRLAEMRSQFVSSVSHELKTPLTAIRMFAETLRLGRLQNRQTREEYIDTIVNESERLTRLLNNVLDFSKIEKGKKTYRPLPASLPEVIGAAARAMEYPLSQQGFKLNVEVEEDLPDVCVDRDALEQAVLNLLHNAMKYSGDSREIDLRLRKSGRLAVIQVIDRGVGIAAQERKKIFEKFYRVPSAENDRLPGTGLGLSLVKHIVAAHGGRVEVESAPGKGSTFSIFLPLEKGG